MTIIAPSILSADFLNLKSEIEKFNELDDIWLHLDIMDGHFVPNLTFGHTVLKKLHTVTKHKLDAHFMVERPENYIQPFKELNIHNFTFHWEAATHHDRLIAELKEHFPSVGVSLNPSTNIGVIPEYLLEKLDLILVMTVNPGFGGQSFIGGCMDKIEALNKLKKQKGYKYQIQVDGGVNDSNCHSLINIGADNLVAGSYIFGDKDKDYTKRVNSLR